MNLNKGQQEAVDCNSNRILVLAGAGTGKTHTMLSRISKLVKEGINPYNILVLTFTNAAAFDMESRYRTNHKNKIVPLFNTFHAFCYKLIISDINIRKLIGYSDVPNIIDDAQMKLIDTKVRQQCGTKLSNDKISGKKTVSMKEKFDYDLYWKAFRKAIKSENLITFDIMCYDVCQLFTNNSPLIQQYMQRYQYIFVDEFQDTDPQQWDFVKSFIDSNIFVVGDVQQAIYGFRGATSSIIKSLTQNDDWRTIRLVENYRSTTQICDYSNLINTGIHESYKLDLTSNILGEEVLELGSPYTGNTNPKLDETVSNIIEDMFGVTAILCRTNQEVNNIKKLLDNKGVIYNSNNAQKDVVDVLKGVLDNTYLLGWLSTKLDATRYIEWIRLCTIDANYATLDEFCKLYSSRYTIRVIIDNVMHIRTILRDNKLLAYQQCNCIIEYLGMPQRLIDGDIDTPHKLINYVIDIATKSEDSALYVGTIHSVKGLEYDTVHVLGVHGNSFKIEDEEHRNLYYVACTRAKSKLFIYRNDFY